MRPEPIQTTTDGTAVLPSRLTQPAPVSLPRVRISLGPLAGRLALASLVLCAGAVVAFAAAGPSVLVPRSQQLFPGWEAGPLHALFHGLPNDPMGLSIGLSCVIVAMAGAYAVTLAAYRSLSLRVIVAAVLAMHVILLMSPPLQLTDIFNYLGYARLGGLHHLNPYTHVISQEIHDPVYRLATWHGLHSPYGPLFTAASYLLPFGSLAAAYWAIKVATVLASLAFLGLVCLCARQLGRDPRFALLFVAANPIYLIFAIGGFHNDFFMLIPSVGAISLLLARRYRWAGAVLMLAVAIKFSAVLLLPFLLVAVRDRRSRLDVLVGAALGAIPLAAMSIALFGFTLPNLQDQSTLLTDFSIPNVFGRVLAIGGGTPPLLSVAKVGLLVSIVLLLRARGDWISRAGWATLALIASLAWLMPWYVIWLAPLAALGSSVRLRQATGALTVFLIATFVPITGIYFAQHRIEMLGTHAGHVSQALQKKLAQ
jgi:hypothetical protein